MTTILYSKNEKVTVKTCFIPEEMVYTVIFEYPNGDVIRVQDFKSVMFALEIHDFWCKYTGVISTPFSGSQVEKHLTTASLRAC